MSYKMKINGCNALCFLSVSLPTPLSLRPCTRCLICGVNPFFLSVCVYLCLSVCLSICLSVSLFLIFGVRKSRDVPFIPHLSGILSLAVSVHNTNPFFISHRQDQMRGFKTSQKMDSLDNSKAVGCLFFFKSFFVFFFFSLSLSLPASQLL